MYSFLHQRLGSKWAYWLTAIWYAMLILLVVLTFTGPAAEFRYGNLR